MSVHIGMNLILENFQDMSFRVQCVKDGETYEAWLSKEEYDLQLALNHLFSTMDKQQIELIESVLEDYGSITYEYGYENGRQDGPETEDI